MLENGEEWGLERPPAQDGGPQVESGANSTFLQASRSPHPSGRPQQPRGRRGQVRPSASAGQLERTGTELINLSRALAGNRQGAAGWLFGAPLIVTVTLTPEVT